MLKINVKTIHHSQQRYPTVGDWWYDLNKDTWEIRVSELGDWRYEALVALHEQHEVLIAYQRQCHDRLDIPSFVANVDLFDKNFERERTEGLHSAEEEPGDDPNCPVRKEHFFATSLERLFAAELGVDWNEYSKAVEALPGYESQNFYDHLSHE